MLYIPLLIVHNSIGTTGYCTAVVATVNNFARLYSVVLGEDKNVNKGHTLTYVRMSSLAQNKKIRYVLSVVLLHNT